MEDCIFCKILAGEIPCKKIYEDEDTFSFYDINPQAPVHVLVISKKHIRNIARNEELSDHELAACLRTCAKVAKQLGVEEDGYRVITNIGKNACQSENHMHFHVLGGKQLDPGLV